MSSIYSGVENPDVGTQEIGVTFRRQLNGPKVPSGLSYTAFKGKKEHSE